MKKTFLTIFSILLAGVIMASSSGLYLNKMVCLMSGKSYVSLTPFDLCPVDQNTELEDECCDFSQMLLKMEIDANVQQLSLQPDMVFLHTHTYAFDHFSFQLSERELYACTDLPPPVPVGAFLSLIQVYLI